MTKEAVVERINSLGRKNGCFYGFETLTTPHLTKKNRSTKEPTNFVVQVRAKFSAQLGISYQNCVNNARERNGEERDFVAQKPTGKHYVGDSKWLMEADNYNDRFYIAMDKVGGVKKEYLIDGRVATDAEIEDLKANYLDKPSKSPYNIQWRTIDVSHILAIY